MFEAAGLSTAVEHTLLRADASREDVERFGAEAARLGCFGVCVHPCWVRPLREEILREGGPAVVTVTGFPFGADRSETKALGAALARDDGAAEVDMVVNLGLLLSGDTRGFVDDIAAVRASAPDLVLKAILETGLLSAVQLREAASLAREAGADFLKTSTGFGPRGATEEDVRILAAYGPVKAAGGIRTRAQAEAMLAAGATRIGTSAAAAILGDGTPRHEDPH